MLSTTAITDSDRIMTELMIQQTKENIQTFLFSVMTNCTFNICLETNNSKKSELG